MPALASLGLSSPLAISPVASAARPPFATQTQECNNWCWAAVTSALLTHFDRPRRSQCQLVSEWKGRNSCLPAEQIDEPASLDEILNGIAGIPARWNGRSFFRDPYAAFVNICSEIDSGRPVPMTIAWRGAAAWHCVCAFGFTSIGDEPALWIFDPWPAWSGDGNVRLRTVASMRSYEQAPAADASVGYWSEAYLLS